MVGKETFFEVMYYNFFKIIYINHKIYIRRQFGIIHSHLGFCVKIVLSDMNQNKIHNDEMHILILPKESKNLRIEEK